MTNFCFIMTLLGSPTVSPGPSEVFSASRLFTSSSAAGTDRPKTRIAASAPRRSRLLHTRVRHQHPLIFPPRVLQARRVASMDHHRSSPRDHGARRPLKQQHPPRRSSGGSVFLHHLPRSIPRHFTEGANVQGELPSEPQCANRAG